MRKVRIPTNLISKKLAGKIAEPDLEALTMINKITEQMLGLLNDLVLYTNLLNPNEKYRELNLHDIFKEAYNKAFKSSNIHFQIASNIPDIKGSPV